VKILKIVVVVIAGLAIVPITILALKGAGLDFGGIEPEADLSDESTGMVVETEDYRIIELETGHLYSIRGLDYSSDPRLDDCSGMGACLANGLRELVNRGHHIMGIENIQGYYEGVTVTSSILVFVEVRDLCGVE